MLFRKPNRKQFTGYERDDETNLDFAQARYFNSGVGRFSSPDSFTNDTHVGDPQSWNLYVYVRNNPLKLIDPLGTKARVRSSYDKDTNTTTIVIDASFSVYAAEGQGVSEEDKKNYAARLKAGIEGEYNREFTINGQKYVMTANISVSIASDENGAIASGADNLVELGTDDLISGNGGEAIATAFHKSGESFDRMRVQIGLTGLFNDYENTFAHEFGHLLGVPDRDRRGLFSGDGVVSSMTEEDFIDLFDEEYQTTWESPYVPRGDKKDPGYTTLRRVEGSKVLGSTISNFEVRQTGGLDLTKWRRDVKK